MLLPRIANHSWFRCNGRLLASLFQMESVRGKRRKGLSAFKNPIFYVVENKKKRRWYIAWFLVYVGHYAFLFTMASHFFGDSRFLFRFRLLATHTLCGFFLFSFISREISTTAASAILFHGGGGCLRCLLNKKHEQYLLTFFSRRGLVM